MSKRKNKTMGVEISKTKLVNILPEKETTTLLPVGKSILFVGIPLNKLEEVGFSFKDYQVVCEVECEENNKYNLKISPMYYGIFNS